MQTNPELKNHTRMYLLFIQYICSYASYLEAVCCIRNLRVRHAVVTREQINRDTA
jgi:hypothetical protein